MNQKIYIGLLLALCAGVMLYVYTAGVVNAPHVKTSEDLATTTGDGQTQNDIVPSPLPYGEASLRVGTWGVFEDVRIRPVRIVEDSRCAMDVTCIQAGTVRVELQTVSVMGTSTDVLALGKTLTTEAEAITFNAVSPETISTRMLTEDQYILTFRVEKREIEEAPRAVTPVISTGTCYVGGCSSQLCSDTPGMASTCEYKEEYGCYAHATCERQSDGQCGWTPNAAFNACMLDAKASAYPQ